MIVTMSSQGQVTLPVEVRQRLGLGDGAKLDVVVGDDRIELVPVKEPLESLRGILKPQRSLSLDQIEAAIKRGAIE